MRPPARSRFALDWLAARQRDASLNFARGFGAADIDAAVAEAIELGPYPAGTDPAVVRDRLISQLQIDYPEYWSESEHSRSATSPSYRAALDAAMEGALDKSAVQRNCVWCHAPTALVTGDYSLQRPITREGVSCDFCHTVVDVDLSRPDHPFDLQPGKIKRGPLEYAKSPYHETAYSALHKASPLLCAACHELSQVGGPLIVVGAGLPHLPSVLSASQVATSSTVLMSPSRCVPFDWMRPTIGVDLSGRDP